jgi:hypothetical protein
MTLIVYIAVFVLQWHLLPPETVYGGTYATLAECQAGLQNFQTNLTIVSARCEKQVDKR